MKISFVLPGLIKIPIGGVKVIYRHAAELAKRGHKVAIISPRTEGYRLRDLIKAGAVKVRDRWHGVEDHPCYETPPGVDHQIIPAPDPKFIPRGDILVATGWQTVYWIDRMPAEKGKKFYFIQNLETYQGNEEVILNTWKLPLTKIVIAQWLKDYAAKLGETAYGPVPNAIDPDEFSVTTPIENRADKVAMLYHRFPIKGAAEGLAVLEKVRESRPLLTATIFASRKPKVSLPSWIDLRIRPGPDRLREIYNSSAVFLHTSHQEGWGLPAMEAMACGCAVAAAANEGVKEFINHDQTGLLSPIGDVDAMVRNVQLLLDNLDERVRLAKAGKTAVDQFSWQKSSKQLETILQANL